MFLCSTFVSASDSNNSQLKSENAETLNQEDTVLAEIVTEKTWESESDEFQRAEEVILMPQGEISTPVGGPVGAREATESQMAEAALVPDGVLLTPDQNQRRASWVYLDNSFRVYAQINDYYCGPATVQAALNYLTGQTPGQVTIAAGCGTTTSGTYLADMKSYLNAMQNQHTYTARYGADGASMCNYLYTGIASYDAPSIIGLSVLAIDGWLYNSPAHFMSVYGAMSDQSSFALGDPWIKYPGSGLTDRSASYVQPALTVEVAYSSVNLGLMY